MAELNEDDIVETDFECISCGYTRFVHSRALPDGAPSPFANWPWLKVDQVFVYMCARCGFMHWFGPSLEDPDECLECGTPLAENETVCPACGWTYEGPDAEGDDPLDGEGLAPDDKDRGHD